MSDKYQTFRSKQSVKARKVTASEGEEVVTLRGAEVAPKGSYVILHEEPNGKYLSVVDKETFEAQYNVSGGSSKSKQPRKSTAKKATAKKQAPATVSQKNK